MTKIREEVMMKEPLRFRRSIGYLTEVVSPVERKAMGWTERSFGAGPQDSVGGALGFRGSTDMYWYWNGKGEIWC